MHTQNAGNSLSVAIFREGKQSLFWRTLRLLKKNYNNNSENNTSEQKKLSNNICQEITPTSHFLCLQL